MRDVRELLVYNDIGANLGGLFLLFYNNLSYSVYFCLSDRALTLNDSIRGAYILIMITLLKTYVYIFYKERSVKIWNCFFILKLEMSYH